MARLAGSKNKPKASVIRDDGYAEAFSGAGTNRDRSSFAGIKQAMLLDNLTLQNLYLGDGFAKKIVDIPCEEMTRAGIEIEGLEDEALEEYIQSKLQELDVMRFMNDGLRWSRLFGGAVIVYGLNDGGMLDNELNTKGIKDVEFLRVYDRWQATIQKRYDNPQDVNYGNPELWLISPVNGGSPYTVHNSRIHAFDGDSIPDLLRQQNKGWGASVLQSCYNQLIRLGMSHQYANMLLERSQQAVHKIPELAQTLRSPGGEALIQKRVDIVDMVRGILNTIVIDGMEDYQVSSQTMTGVKDILEVFAEALSAVCGIPATVLLGKSQGGLSNTNKAEMDSWYARIGAMQNDILRKPIDKIVTYLILAKTGNDMPYELCFKELAIKSDKDNADIEKIEAEAKKIKMETMTGYAAINALDPNEIRATIAEEYDVTGDAVILEVDDNLDSVDLAISELNRVKYVVNNNMPLNVISGDLAQAELEKEVSKSVIEAIGVLENYLKAKV